jgi:hypothetical protein
MVRYWNLVGGCLVFPSPFAVEAIFNNSYFGSFVEKLNGHSCVALCQGVLFYAIDLYVYFSASTMIILFLWLYYSLKSGIIKPPTFLFWLRIAFTIQSLLCEFSKLAGVKINTQK